VAHHDEFLGHYLPLSEAIFRARPAQGCKMNGLTKRNACGATREEHMAAPASAVPLARRSRARRNPALYVTAVLTLYVDLPDTPLRASVPDQRQARTWCDRGVSERCPISGGKGISRQLSLGRPAALPRNVSAVLR